MDWNAGIYHRVSEPQFEWGMAVLNRLPLEGNERVLDVGCGTGRLTAELARRVPGGRVVGTDRSAAMLEEAGSQLAACGVPLVRADAARLPFLAAFDVVFSTATFHWVLDHDALFAGIWQALRPGGRLHAQCGGGPNLARLRARAAALMRDARFRAGFDGRWREPWRYASPEETERRLRAIGFEEVEVFLQPAPVAFPGPQEFRTFVDHVCLRPYLELLPESLRSHFSEALVEQAAADSPPYELDYCRLNIAGRKESGSIFRRSPSGQ